MTAVMDSAGSADAAAHGHPDARTYFRIWVWLLVLTIVEVLWAFVLTGLGPVLIIGGLAVTAIAKAALVGAFFMHLKFEVRVIHIVAIFVVFLAFVMGVALQMEVTG